MTEESPPIDPTFGINPPRRDLIPFRPWPPWKCRFCQPTLDLPDRTSLVQHEDQHFNHWDTRLSISSDRRSADCPYCPYRGPTDTVRLHGTVHRSYEASFVIWECPFCPWSTKRRHQDLKTHITAVHNTKGKNYHFCFVCHLSFPLDPARPGLNPHNESGCPPHFRCPFCAWFSSATQEERAEHVNEQHKEIVTNNPGFSMRDLDRMIVRYPN